MAKPTNNQLNQMPPPQAPVAPPVYTGHHDHSFTLQAIMELQKSSGKMEGVIGANCSSIESLEGKIDRLTESVERHNKLVFAAGILLAIFIGVGGYIVDKSISFGLEMAKDRFEQPAPPKK